MSRTLSVCIIAHNEEPKLARTLESVSFADEIILVDCESTDGTAAAAQRFKARVFQRPNLANLNVNKNYSFDQAVSDFILCLDADEVVPPATAEEMRITISENPAQNGFFLPRRNYFLGHWLKHGGQYPDWQLRLFRRGRGRFPEKHIHERLEVEGAVGRLKNPLDHFTYESLEECERKLDFYTTFEAQALHLQGIKPSPITACRFLYWTPGQRFVRRYLLKLGFLDGAAGWLAMRQDLRNFRLRYRKLVSLHELHQGD
ncbi:MAG: glycosyltransferase family 2 protein [bacterium]